MTIRHALSCLLMSALLPTRVFGDLVAGRQVTAQQACMSTMCVSATVNGSDVQCMFPYLAPDNQFQSSWRKLDTLSSLGTESLGWMAMGFGRFMANTPMIIMWPNNNEVVLSQRTAPREVMPTVDPNPPRIATVVDSLTSLSGDKPSFGFSIPANADTTQFIIMAFSKDSPGSSDPSADLDQHIEFKMAVLKLEPTATPTSGSTAIPTKTSSSDEKNPQDDIPLLPYQRMIVAHGIFLTVAFLLLLPSGALLARYLRTFTPTWFMGHSVIQFWIAGPAIIAGVALGVQAVSKSNGSHFSDNHKKLGVVIFALYILQLSLGAVIHWIKSRHATRRPIQNYAHAVFGLLIIAMAMYQVHDGFTSEWQRTTGREGLSNGFTILFFVWIVFITLLYFLGLALLPRQFRQESQPKRLPIRDDHVMYHDTVDAE